MSAAVLDLLAAFVRGVAAGLLATTAVMVPLWLGGWFPDHKAAKAAHAGLRLASWPLVVVGAWFEDRARERMLDALAEAAVAVLPPCWRCGHQPVCRDEAVGICANADCYCQRDHQRRV